MIAILILEVYDKGAQNPILSIKQNMPGVPANLSSALRSGSNL